MTVYCMYNEANGQEEGEEMLDFRVMLKFGETVVEFFYSAKSHGTALAELEREHPNAAIEFVNQLLIKD